MGIIYTIKNDINTKEYIGKTETTLLNRWYHHKDAYLTQDWHLYRAMRKYGIEHFWIEEIEKCDNSIINEREQYWIKEKDTFNNGYNMTIGGEGRVSLNRQEVLDQWNKGYSVKEIALNLDCWSSSIIDILKELNIYDATEVNKRKNKYIAKINSPDSIVCYDISGDIINIYESLYEVEQLTGFNKKSIQNAIRNNVGLHGYLWGYLNGPKPTFRPVKECKKHQIEQIDLNTNEVIQVFNSASEAARMTGVDASTIIKVCKGKRNKAGGFKWQYKKEPI